ncbi:MAG: TonB-dependent receptor [Tannerella sp.]|jgi:TonB-linked SusC/RagA family outer membrane protein|nr:TonB-dependent receptor [Tannerella sp.]
MSNNKNFFLRAMLCCTLMVFSLCATASAHISLSIKNKPVREVIKDIEKTSDYRFFYNDDLPGLDANVSIHIQEGTITAVMNRLAQQANIAYSIIDSNQIVLSAKAVSPQQAGRRITGVVSDEHGEPVIGANIVEKGTVNGTVSDIDGRFSLEVPDNAILQISFIGYISQEISVLSATGGGNSLLITLLEDAKALEEVVVIGYGTQRKGEVASAITSVKAENFIKVPSPDASKMIRGQVAGLAVVSHDANPLSTSQIMLRGITTLKASASPLVLIDGIPGDLMTVSPDDIEQIDVLKDGSAAAIYGTRGTNGVIIITTKNARGEMPTTVDVNAYLSTQQITRKLPFMTYDQYVDKVRQGKPGAIDNGGHVDWLDEVLQTPLTQVYNISLRGGSKTTNYVASFDYRSLEGIIKRSDNRMIYPRIEVTHRMFDNMLKINASVSGYQQRYFDASDGGGYNTDVYKNAIMFNPTDPIKDENGVWTERSINGYYNPLALLYEVDGENKATNMRMFADVIFTPIEGLDIKYLVSSNTYNQVRGFYQTQKHASTVKDGRNGFASRGTNLTTNDLAEFTVQYHKTLAKDHTFTLLGGYSWLKRNYQFYWMNNFNFPSDDYTYNSMGQGQALNDGRAGMGSEQTENTLIGYFGRLNYSYKGKYMLAASVRYEGSSKFGANHKWGTFPAVSAAWNIKGEGFMEDAALFSTLKLRAGFGVTGTEPSSPYMSLNTLSFGDYAYANGTWIKSIRPASNANPDLRWEKKEETNIGLDFGFFEDRLTGSIDFYNRDTKDLLWDYTVPSPPYLFSSMTANAGSMRNRGVEIAIQAVPVQTNDFRWVTNANFSTNKNTLLSLSNDQFISIGYSNQGSTGEPIQTYTHRIQEGEPIGNFFGFKTIDVDDKGYWIIEGEDGNPKPMAEQQPTDKQILGNGLPKYYLNWNNSVSYKNIDLGVTMRGAFGFQILNNSELFYAVPMQLSRGNLFQKAYEPVFGKRPLADDQELQYVSYFIEDGDYWKIDNVSLGYTFNFNSKWVQRFRLYGTISNLLVLTGYSGIDPEVPISGLAPGHDDKWRYPAARTFTIGASFKF